MIRWYIYIYIHVYAIHLKSSELVCDESSLILTSSEITNGQSASVSINRKLRFSHIWGSFIYFDLSDTTKFIWFDTFQTKYISWSIGEVYWLIECQLLTTWISQQLQTILLHLCYNGCSLIRFCFAYYSKRWLHFLLHFESNKISVRFKKFLLSLRFSKRRL